MLLPFHPPPRALTIDRSTRRQCRAPSRALPQAKIADSEDRARGNGLRETSRAGLRMGMIAASGASHGRSRDPDEEYHRLRGQEGVHLVRACRAGGNR